MLGEALGFLVPYEYATEDTSVINPKIYDSEIYRFIMSFHGIFSAFQLLMMIFVFRKDTPRFYYLIEDYDEALETELLIYANTEDELSLNQSPFNHKHHEERVPFFAHFTKEYRFAFFLGIFLGVYQQMTGVNSVIFYSNTLFTIDSPPGRQTEYEAKVGTTLIGIVNLLSSMSAIPLLKFFGRKPLLLVGAFGMCA